MDQVISAAISSHPIAFSGTEKVPFSLSTIPASVRPSRQLRYIRYQRLCCNGLPSNLRNTGISLSRNQRYLVHALPLQAVTTDNDSEDGTSPGPSSSVEYAGIFQADKGARQSLLYYIQVWYTNARNQNVSVIIKQVLERSKTKLQAIDKRQVQQQIKNSKLTTSAIHQWERTQPWIKWPVAIFVPWFFLISVFYGISVSMDLLPLWTIGPIMACLAIKANLLLSARCKQWVADRKLKELLYVMEGVKTGQLPRLVVEAIGSRYKEVKLCVVKKKSDLVSFIQSREIIVILRQYADRKLRELWEACIDKYEDLWLLYLYLDRKLKNII